MTFSRSVVMCGSVIGEKAPEIFPAFLRNIFVSVLPEEQYLSMMLSLSVSATTCSHDN